MNQQEETRRAFVDLWAIETLLQRRRLVVEMPADCNDLDLQTFSAEQLNDWANATGVETYFSTDDIEGFDVLNGISIDNDVPGHVESDLVIGRSENGTLVGNPEQEWWWIAINGTSCAVSKRSSRDIPTVSPVPEVLIGFPTRHEQLTARDTYLRRPPEEVALYMDSLPERISTGQVRHFSPDHPEPQTEGPTLWGFEHPDSATGEQQ